MNQVNAFIAYIGVVEFILAVSAALASGFVLLVAGIVSNCSTPGGWREADRLSSEVVELRSLTL
jgi:hypothetical protein